MWNRDMYNAIIKKIKETKHWNGHEIKSKEDVYRLLSQEVYLSVDAVRSWTRPNSNGPGDELTLLKVEEMLGVKLTKQYEEQEENKMLENTYSDFIKQNIKECYLLMIDYLHAEDIEDENIYCSMRAEMQKYRVCIPKEIFKKIEACADKFLDPIIYDEENFFAELHSEELGFYDAAHCFHLKDEKATFKYMGMFLEKIMWVEDQIEQFGMKELYPILIG